MFAYVFVVENPYFAVTDKSGAFSIGHVPPGTYKIRMWHEGWLPRPAVAGHVAYSSPVTLEQEVTVSAGDNTQSSFILSRALETKP